MKATLYGLLATGAIALNHTSTSAPREIPPAYGLGVNLTEKDFDGSRSFLRGDKIVGTYYFYWYNADTREHTVDGDGTDALTTHPRTLEGFSYNSVAWHKQQLSDMIAAGIDIVLPVFWGAPSEHDPKAHLHWSYAGIGSLVQAREELVRQGKEPPRIGLFYDTSTLRHNGWHEHIDLTTTFGKHWFYATIRDFFSMVPPKHWAMINRKPIVLLYSASFAKRHDQSLVDFTKEEFAKQFCGRVPFLVREVSWNIKADDTVAWGGALGLKSYGVASLGPGYDHSAVPGRTPLIVDRRGGEFYEENWLKCLRRPSHFVMVETWNEFHEGTDVCESREHGRQYIELTRKYAELFKQGWQPPWPKGKYTDAKCVSILLENEAREAGLRQIQHEDGLTEVMVAGPKKCRTLRRDSPKSRYMYFAADDSFKRAGTMRLDLEITYFDAAGGTIAVEFDGSDDSAPFAGAYTRSPDVLKLNGTKMWKNARFSLPDARLANSQNSGADLRLVSSTPNLFVRELFLRYK